MVAIFAGWWDHQIHFWKQIIQARLDLILFCGFWGNDENVKSCQQMTTLNGNISAIMWHKLFRKWRYSCKMLLTLISWFIKGVTYYTSKKLWNNDHKGSSIILKEPLLKKKLHTIKKINQKIVECWFQFTK